MSRALKWWFIIALGHLGLIYTLARACVVVSPQALAVPQQQHIVDAALVHFESNSESHSAHELTGNDVIKAQQASFVASNHVVESHGVRYPKDVAKGTDAPVEGTHTVREVQTLNGGELGRSAGSAAGHSQTQQQAQPEPVLTPATHIGGHLHNVQPYPEVSKELGEEGVVTVSAMVEPDGRASSVDVVKSSGFARLDRAARDAVLTRYRFTPATLGGEPVRYRYRFDIRFNLKKE